MIDYRTVFPKRHTFLAVIHVEDSIQASENAKIAFDGGVDGIFLINHSISADALHRCHTTVRNLFPDKWIGLNWLDLRPREALIRMEPSINGLWIDNGGIYEDDQGNTEAAAFSEARETLESSFLLFGGVAFKHQEHVTNLERVTSLAKPYIDVITTSGIATGVAADTEKIRIIKQAAGDHPVAIASGITPKNISQYMDDIDCFLVATGISDSHTELNPQKVARLAHILS